MIALKNLRRLEDLAVGRTQSLFAVDFEQVRPTIAERLDGRRVAVIGAAGSIGAAVVRLLVDFRLDALALFDLSENGLAEIVRDLRSSGVRVPKDFAASPIGLGSPEFDRCIKEQAGFDVVFNLCAIKHVRSEKDVYSLLRMIDTNVLFVDEFLRKHPPRERFFSVSSDKAARPANLMGASKALMESVLHFHAEVCTTTSARFANVAFSAGSLLDAFLKRLEKGQPLSAPDDVRRFFLRHDEAAELCLLAALVGESGESFVPKEEHVEERGFHEIALELLETFGYEPEICSSDAEARESAAELIKKGRWPCFFAPSDTAGEKMREEFVGPDEHVDRGRFERIAVVRSAANDEIRDVLSELRRRRDDPATSKSDLIEIFQRGVPTLRHVESPRHLDQKM